MQSSFGRGRRRWGAAAAGTAVLAALLTVPAGAAQAKDGRPTGSVVVTTDKGAVRGSQHEGYRTFQGVPYAAPPVGSRRLAAPQPAPAWQGTLDATAPREQCAQLTRAGNRESFDEDCLYLNVTTPARGSTARTNLPVMVWIHGGSFVYGTGASYDASKLAREGDVVVVTINYRLGPLGFLNHPALPDSNLALRDQQAALRWVQANAAAFGGDPKKVTVFGESAGAASVCALLAAPDAAGLFARAIPQSYSCAAAFATEVQADAAGQAFAARVGCTEPATVAGCLRGKTSEELLRAWTGGAFAVGDRTLPIQPGEALATGRAHRVDLMHGNTRDENRLFTPLTYGTSITAQQYEAIVRQLHGTAADRVLARYPVGAYPAPIYALTALTSDAGSALSTCTHVKAYELASDAPRPLKVYAYQFRDRTADPLIDLGPGFDEGAQHATELPYLFPGLFGDGLTAEQEALSTTMVRYWTSFAHSGNPNGKGTPTWPRYQDSRDVLGLDLASAGGVRTVDVAAESQCAFWASLGR